MTSEGRVDVAAIRARHPLVDAVTAAGVELRPSGHGWIGCCPFHDDSSPSLSVGGVPDRFHCFGCGATGDVIDFVGRLHNLPFRDAVNRLESGTLPTADRGTSTVAARPRLRIVRDTDPPAQPPVTVARAHEINAIAWQHMTGTVQGGFASYYLRHHRGIDLVALDQQQGRPSVGYHGSSWTHLTDRLSADGVTDDELLVMDLAQRTRAGHLVDTLRSRLVVPVTNERGEIDGFIGRDISGRPAVPKYRNPTLTPTFDKSHILYRPTAGPVHAMGRAVVVEGALDAVALAAVAATAGVGDRIAPCTALGVNVSAAQAEQVLALSLNPPLLALDADDAGREGTLRWLTALSLDRGRPALLLQLPEGRDPADWVSEHGPSGLDAFLSEVHLTLDDDLGPHDDFRLPPRPTLPGRDLVRLALDRSHDPIRDVATAITPLAKRLGPGMRATLVAQAVAEMTSHGCNPGNAFTRAVTRELRDLHPVPLQGEPTPPAPTSPITPLL